MQELGSFVGLESSLVFHIVDPGMRLKGENQRF